MIKTSYTFCALPFLKLKVDSEGYCNFCCGHTRKCLGNIIDLGLESIWNGELAKEIRRETARRKLHSTCNIQSCPHFYRDLERASTEKIIKQEYPVFLELDLPIQHCNIGGENPSDKNPACIMCERSMWFSRQEDRLDDICEILKKISHNFKWVHIQGIAEPFWKNRIFELVEKLELKTEETNISTTTNGTIFSKEKLEKWLQYPKTSLMFSLDAASPETYKKIRIWDAYDKITDNILKFSMIRTKEQTLRIHNTINLFNINEVKQMVEFAYKANVDEINFNSTWNLGENSVNENNYKQFVEAQEIIKKTAKDLGVNATFVKPLYNNYNESKDLVQINI